MGILKNLKDGFTVKRDEIRSTALVPVTKGEVVPVHPRTPVAGHPHAEILQPFDDDEVSVAREMLRFEMWCSKTGKPFIAVAERHGKTLWLIGNERAGKELAGSAWQPGSDYFEIDADPAWCCPWCGTREDRRHDFLRLFWTCTDPACGEPIHCCGSRRGLFECACGQRMSRSFVRVDVFRVYVFNGLRGASGRGRTRLHCPAGGGSDICFASYPGASTGSILRR
jgi:hypothetical protein